jgi:hypothetical protein
MCAAFRPRSEGRSGSERTFQGIKVAAEIRNAIDTYLAGITPQELEMLDAATRRAEQDIEEMIAIMHATNARIAKRHRAMELLRRVR